MLKQYLWVLCFLIGLIMTESRLSGHYLNKRASMLNEGATQIAGAVNFAEAGINGNLGGIGDQCQKTIDDISSAITKAGKSGLNAAVEVAKAGVTGFLAIPKLAANSAVVVASSLSP